MLCYDEDLFAQQNLNFLAGIESSYDIVGMEDGTYFFDFWSQMQSWYAGSSGRSKDYGLCEEM